MASLSLSSTSTALADPDALRRAARSASFCASPGSEDELWDVYDAAGNKTGRVHRRAEPLRPGDRHLCVHVWVQDPEGSFLITKRSARKSMAGLWECTGGCVVAGEESLDAALREVREETGLRLDPKRAELLLCWEGEFFLCDVYRFRQDFSPGQITLQPGETDGAMLADAEAIRALAAAGKFVNLPYLERVLGAK